MIGLKNLLSNFVSATDLFSLSAAFLSFSAVFLRKELCCFKVPNIDFTDFETEVIKVAGTSTVFPFLVLFFFSFVSSDSESCAAPGSNFCAGIFCDLNCGDLIGLIESADITVFFALNLESSAFLFFLTFITSSCKILDLSSPEPLV